MAETHTVPSPYLRERLKKADVARAQHAAPNSAQSPSGRSQANRSLISEVSSAPPSVWKMQSSGSSAPRSSTTGHSGSHTRRQSGMREEQEDRSKLRTENGSLRLELTLAKDRVSELNLKMADYDHLRNEYESLLQTCREQNEELATREQAVDEAAVLIMELEYKNEELEAALAARRNHRSTSSRSYADRSSSSSAVPRRTQTPTARIEETSLRGKVSPDGSARMTRIAQTDPNQQPLPPFLTSDNPRTAHLRRHYLTEDDRLLRPIPSHASLLETRSDLDEDENEDLHAALALKSPALSAISVDEPHIIRNEDFDDEDGVPPYDSPSPHVRKPLQDRLNDTGRWIADNGLPIRIRREASKGRPAQRDFQSLEGVLQSESAAPSFNQLRSKSQRKIGPYNNDSRTPPLGSSPAFIPNGLPPTPDTMMTTANTSMASFTVDRHTYHHDPAYQALKDTRPSVGSRRRSPYASSELKHYPTVSNTKDFMPSELDHYDDMGEADPFGRPTYTSSSSESPETVRRPMFPSTSLAGSTMIDTDSLRDYPPSRSSQSPERTFESRMAPLSRNVRSNVVDASQRQEQSTQHMAQYDGSLDTRTLSSRGTGSASYSNTSLPPASRSAERRGINSGIPMMHPSNAMPAIKQDLSPTPLRDERRPSLAAAVRDRFHRIARRQDNVGEDRSAPRGRISRTNSITQKLRMRRNSSVSHAKPATVQSDDTTGINLTPGHDLAYSTTSPQYSQEKQTTVSPLPRSQSERNVTQRPNTQSTGSTSSIPSRTNAMSQNATPVAGEFGQLKSPFAGATKSYPTRSVGKGGEETSGITTAVITVPLPRGRRNSISRVRGAITRSLSRTRSDAPPRQLLSGRRG